METIKPFNLKDAIKAAQDADAKRRQQLINESNERVNENERKFHEARGHVSCNS